MMISDSCTSCMRLLVLRTARARFLQGAQEQAPPPRASLPEQVEELKALGRGAGEASGDDGAAGGAVEIDAGSLEHGLRQVDLPQQAIEAAPGCASPGTARRPNMLTKLFRISSADVTPQAPALRGDELAAAAPGDAAAPGPGADPEALVRDSEGQGSASRCAPGTTKPCTTTSNRSTTFATLVGGRARVRQGIEEGEQRRTEQGGAGRPVLYIPHADGCPQETHHAYPGPIVILGFGSIGQGTLPMLLRHIDIPALQVTIIAKDVDGAEIASMA